MTKEYVVVGFGHNKENGEPYSKALLLVQDYKNASNPSFGFLDTRSVYYTTDIRSIGSSILVEISEVL